MEENIHLVNEEIKANSSNGMIILLLNIVLIIASVFSAIQAILSLDRGYSLPALLLLIISIIYFVIVAPILFAGLKILKPNFYSSSKALYKEYINRYFIRSCRNSSKYQSSSHTK